MCTTTTTLTLLTNMSIFINVLAVYSEYIVSVSLLATSMFSFGRHCFTTRNTCFNPFNLYGFSHTICASHLSNFFSESLMPLIHCVVCVDTKLNKYKFNITLQIELNALTSLGPKAVGHIIRQNGGGRDYVCEIKSKSRIITRNAKALHTK